MAKQYKATMRIPTASKYAFIEVEMEGTAKQITDAYYEVSEAYWKESRSRSAKKSEKVTKNK